MNELPNFGKDPFIALVDMLGTKGKKNEETVEAFVDRLIQERDNAATLWVEKAKAAVADKGIRSGEGVGEFVDRLLKENKAWAKVVNEAWDVLGREYDCMLPGAISMLKEERDLMRARYDRTDVLRVEQVQRAEKAEAELELRKKQLASISQEFNLPPTIRPAEGEIKRLLELAAEAPRLKQRVDDLKFALGDNAGWFDRAMAAEKKRDDLEKAYRASVDEGEHLVKVNNDAVSRLSAEVTRLRKAAPCSACQEDREKLKQENEQLRGSLEAAVTPCKGCEAERADLKEKLEVARKFHDEWVDRLSALLQVGKFETLTEAAKRVVANPDLAAMRRSAEGWRTTAKEWEERALKADANAAKDKALHEEWVQALRGRLRAQPYESLTEAAERAMSHDWSVRVTSGQEATQDWKAKLDEMTQSRDDWKGRHDSLCAQGYGVACERDKLRTNVAEACDRYFALANTILPEPSLTYSSINHELVLSIAKTLKHNIAHYQSQLEKDGQGLANLREARDQANAAKLRAEEALSTALAEKRVAQGAKENLEKAISLIRLCLLAENQEPTLHAAQRMVARCKAAEKERDEARKIAGQDKHWITEYWDMVRQRDEWKTLADKTGGPFIRIADIARALQQWVDAEYPEEAAQHLAHVVLHLVDSQSTKKG